MDQSRCVRSARPRLSLSLSLARSLPFSFSFFLSLSHLLYMYPTSHLITLVCDVSGASDLDYSISDHALSLCPVGDARPRRFLVLSSLDEMGIDTKPERVEVSLPDKNAWVPQVPAALRGQLSAQLWIVRNTPSVRAFFEAWVRCTSDWQLVSDTPSVSPNSKIFKGHRHDQAIMSALLSVKGMDTPHSFQIPKAWSQPHRWYRFKSSGANFSEFCTKPRPISHVSLQ